MTAREVAATIFRLDLDFSKQIQKADEALRRKNYDFAVDLYRHLLDMNPDLGEARAGLRQALKKRHERKKGGRLLRAVSGAAPLAKARTLHKLGKHAACARALEDYLRSSPMDVEANLLLGESLEAATHFQSARAVFEFVAEIAPDNAEGLKHAGAMMQRTGDPQKALEYYERALQADPRDQEAIKARKNLAAETALSAASYDTVQHSREQIVDKEQAQRLERQTRRALSPEELQAELERLEGQYAEDSSNVELMLEMAELHEKLRDAEAALELIERALTYRRDSLELAQKRGALKSKALKKRIAKADAAGDAELAGRLEQELAQFELEDARVQVAANPGDASLRLALGRLLMRAGELDEALGELQKANNDPRVKKDAAFYLARCFHEKGVLDLARKGYEGALEAQSGMTERAKDIVYHLGSIAEVQGDAAGARSWYIRIYEVDIGYRDVAQKMETLA